MTAPLIHPDPAVQALLNRYAAARHARNQARRALHGARDTHADARARAREAEKEYHRALITARPWLPPEEGR